MPESPKSGEKPELIEVEVARGRSVLHDGQTYTAGQKLKVPKEAVDDLRVHGFLHDPTPVTEPAPGPRVGLVATERR